MQRFARIRSFVLQDVPLKKATLPKGLALRTAQRWVQLYRDHGLLGLGRKHRSDKSRRRISKRLQQAIEGLALKPQKLSVAAIRRQAAHIAKRLGEPLPSYTTVRRVIAGLDPGLVMMAHEGTKAYRDNFDLVHRRQSSEPNEIWQADHTQLDVLVRDGKDARKPWLTIILDDYSRAVAGYLVSFQGPSAIQTALALRQAIWRKSNPAWEVCGIPQMLYTDHGSDFTSKHIEQVAADLKIRMIFSTIGRPRGRGKIERFFQSLSQVLLTRLPGYAPPGTKKPQAILSLAQLIQEIEDYLLLEYNVTSHTGTGQVPKQRWQAGGFLPQMPQSLEALDLLLLTVPKPRKVQSDGIHFMGMRYIDINLAPYVGEGVVIRYDPRDIAQIRVFFKGRFLCKAVCQDIAGETVPLREIVHARDRHRRVLRTTIKDRQKAADDLIERRQWSKTEEKAEDTPRSTPTKQTIKLYRTE